MKINLKSLAPLAFLATIALGEEVVTLTQENFHATVKDNQFVLAEFYAPWCGHCKKLAPEYEKAAVALKDHEPKVMLAKIDATEHDGLAKEFGVKGFPTIKWFVNGEPTDYAGPREEAGIVAWIKKKSGPPAKTIEGADALAEFKKEADAVVHGVFPTEEAAKAFLAAAQTDDSAPYGITIDAEAKESKLTVYQNFDDGEAVFSGDINSADEVKSFIGGNVLPLIIPFSQKIASQVFGGSIREHVLIFAEDADAGKVLGETIKDVAKVKENKEKFMFLTIPQSESRIVDYFGVKAKDLPALRIVHMAEGGVQKYKYTEDEITKEGVEKMIAAYIAGSLEQDLKSAEPLTEEEQAANDVKVFVGKDFEAQVSAAGKDVLVEFYAPWCGHCKKLAPEYEEAAKHFADKDSIVIAKIDATENEVARIPVTGFPTLKFFPADSDEVVDYDGARTKDGIIEFIKKNAKTL